MMLTQEEIECSMHASIADPRLESQFFQDLLNARVYAFVPVSDDHSKLRMVMFRQPTDGLHFIPFFTSEAQALEALGNDRRICTCDGRTLFEATLGATLILNPNHESCILYPEEVTALLTTGKVPPFSTTVLKESRDVYARSPDPIPEKLVRPLKQLYSSLPFVISARLVETSLPENPDSRTTVVCLEVRPPHAQRAARATAIALQTVQHGLGATVDILSCDPGKRPELFDVGSVIFARDPRLPDMSEIAPGIPARRGAARHRPAR
jgi:hypothetical protein